MADAALLTPLIGKSLVVYARKPAAEEAVASRDARRRARHRHRGRAAPDRRRHRRVAAPLGHDPVVPRRPRRPVEPRRGGDGPHPGRAHGEAERAFQWLVDLQRPDGSWHQYYLADRVEQDKLDANVVAYVAAGVWHRWLCTHDRGFAETMWPVVERAIDWVLDLQTPRGEILWARHADGTPWSFALLTGSSSMCHSLRCAIAHAELLGHERPDWELSAARLTHVIRHVPDAFAPKHRWAMDWYYPVLAGVVGGRGRRPSAGRAQRPSSLDGKGVRCVSDRPWVTAAETCECAMAHLAVGDGEMAHDLFRWAQRYRTRRRPLLDGHRVPRRGALPRGERSTYTSSAVVLAADALRRLAGQRPVHQPR